MRKYCLNNVWLNAQFFGADSCPCSPKIVQPEVRKADKLIEPLFTSAPGVEWLMSTWEEVADTLRKQSTYARGEGQGVGLALFHNVPRPRDDIARDMLPSN